MKTTSIVALLLVLTSCGRDNNITGYAALEQHVHKHRVGSSPDQWIEMMGLSGEWEKVGLIFQFQDDEGECEKAIAGLKAANYARDYRCTLAN